MRGFISGMAIMAGTTAPAGARPPVRPDVPVILEAGDTDPCANALVRGLKRDGDGFLSVRAAPDARGRELARLHNGQLVYSCSARGAWVGIVYGRPGDDCGVTSSLARTKAYTGPCRSGWVHGRWIEVYAG